VCGIFLALSLTPCLIIYAARLLTEEELVVLLSPATSTFKQPARVSAYSHRAASLRYDPKTTMYVFHGLCCQHTASSAARQSGSKEENCAALEAFHLCWCPELQSIVDNTTKSIVLGRDVRSTLAKVTHATSIDLESLIRHLLDVYSINTNETNMELKNRFQEIVLKELIPVLDQPVLRYECNICRKWFPNIPRHRHDVKSGKYKPHSQGPIFDTTTPRYFILPLKSGGTSAPIPFQKSLKVILAPNFVPDPHSGQKYSDLPQNIPTASSPLEHFIPIPNLIIPVYVHQLGWLRYLHRVKESPQTFLEVKNLATRRRLFAEDSTAGSVVEDFLLLLPNLVKQYFTQAELRVSTAHSSVRELVTAE
jgi:hypothetical protein